ncbi:MAG: hypothetical protein FWF12_11910 [Betaproteobacteria bacterium]|nr:hypothetical protein [Betaproteobacteria bacterium]
MSTATKCTLHNFPARKNSAMKGGVSNRNQFYDEWRNGNRATQYFLLATGYEDERLLYLAPMVVGNAARGMFYLPALTALDAAARFGARACRRVGGDLRVVAREA